MKISVIGGGNMAQAIIRGVIKKEGHRCSIQVVEPDVSKHAALLADGVARAVDHFDEAVYDCDVVLFAVKPDVLSDVCAQFAPRLTRQLVISVAAGVQLPTISRWLTGYQNIVRVMPNTPASIGLGVSGATVLPGASPDAKQLAELVIGSVGRVFWRDDEADIDVFGVTSGCGPAFVCYFMEAVQEATMRLGFDEQESAEITLETFLGSVQLAARSNESFAQLRDRVTSKGGVTAEAIATYDAEHLKAIVDRGIQAAFVKTKNLGKQA